MNLKKLVRAGLVTVTSLWSLTGSGVADIVAPSDPVPGHIGLTYFDLMKKVVTDLDPASPHGEAHQVVPYRHIEGKRAKTVPENAVAIKYLAPLTVRADGMARLALLADLGPSAADVAEFVLLALFDLTGEPKLLDVVEVGRDRLTGFADKPLVSLGHGSDLIRIDSDHFNSNEDFVDTELILVRNDHFQLVETIFTFDVKACAFKVTELVNVTTLPDPGNAYERIVLAVTEKVELQDDAEGCGEAKVPRPSVRTFRATYRWHPRRRAFVATSSNLHRLDEENKRLIDPEAPAHR